MNTDFKSVDEYIASYSSDIQIILNKIRAAVKAKAPDAMEKISYGIPAYHLYGKPLIYFAGFKNHIGFYATPSGHSKFEDELSKYKQGKGSVQFPLNQPIPLDLIERIVAFRVLENYHNASKSKKLKTCSNGHEFYKSSDCPACPTCEKEKKLDDSVFAVLSAPARRALEYNGITSVEKLATLKEKEVLQFHGMGKSSIPTLQSLLNARGLDFKK